MAGGNGLDNEMFLKLRDMIYEKSGMYFNDSKRYLLESRIGGRLKECSCKSYDEYYYLLKYDPLRFQEINKLFDAVTTNETYFFRDTFQMEAFEKKIMSLIIEKKEKSKKRSIKIWSAGCSTGEEPYTIAILLMENRTLLQNYSIEVLASDISENVLTSARKGIYGSYSLRNLSKEHLKKYFSPLDGKYMVNPEVKKLIRYCNINLYDTEKIKSIQNVDIAFCRNVLIYFDNTSKKKVISNIYDSLDQGGFLIIGPSESLHSVSRAFKLLNFNRTIIYQKE